MTGYRHNVGPVAAELLNRARGSSANMVMVKNYQEMRAARKLVKRGLLVQYDSMPFFFLAEELHRD